MKTEPQSEHKWLDKLVGEWTVTMDGADASHPAWTESVRSLQGLWVVAEGRGEMPGGGAATTIMTLGYDRAKQRYVGTFVGSMMDCLWVYEGVLDEGGKSLTLDTVGPDFGGEGKLVRYQDTVSFQDDDHRELSSRMLGDDGVWKTVMTARYSRRR
jgi:Protein of unknown function (DUF1579)